MTHQHHADDHAADVFTPEYWDSRYGEADRLWSGNPNPQLVHQVSHLPAGTALDVGCGEGADAIWLAARGWQVTGIDISRVALERAAAHALQAGAQVAERTTWQVADALDFEPNDGAYDLISAQYMHLPQGVLTDLHRRLAAAVRIGGTLLLVGHDQDELDQSHAWHREAMFTAAEVTAHLTPGQWRIEVADSLARPGATAQSSRFTKDVVIRAVRLA